MAKQKTAAMTNGHQLGTYLIESKSYVILHLHTDENIVDEKWNNVVQMPVGQFVEEQKATVEASLEKEVAK